MWIAGGGEKVTLKIAAQYADYTNFDGSPEGFDHKSAILEGHCDDLGRDFGDIVRSANYNVVIGETEADVEDRLQFYGELLRKGGVADEKAAAAVDDLRKQPAVGTPDKIVSMFKDMEARGMTYAITYFAEAAYDRSGIELFEQTVAPELRG